MNPDSCSLDEIVGTELAAVTFVRGYLQLQFEPGPTLNVLTPVTVRSGSSLATTGQEGFAGLLVAQVDKTVTGVTLRDAEWVEISFGDGSAVVVSLRPKDYVVAEAISFQRRDGTLVVI